MPAGRVSAIALGLLLSGCNPMYLAGPAPNAIFHQQKDVSAFVNTGLHGVGAGVGVALTDNIAVRLSGGYRPWNEGQNGFGLAGVTGYLALRRDGFRTGPERNVRGLRAALSLDFGGGGGNGNSRGYNLTSATTINRFSGRYLQGQVQGDIGYEWPLILLVGTARVTVFNFKSITAAYLEPSFAFRVGPEFLRFELQVGFSLPMTGNTANLGGAQLVIFSAGVSGLFESAPKPPSEELEPGPAAAPLPGEAPPGPPPPPPPLSPPPLSPPPPPPPAPPL